MGSGFFKLLQFCTDGGKGLLWGMGIGGGGLHGTHTVTGAVADIGDPLSPLRPDAVLGQNLQRTVADHTGVYRRCPQQAVKVGRCPAHHLVGGCKAGCDSTCVQPAQQRGNAP